MFRGKQSRETIIDYYNNVHYSEEIVSQKSQRKMSLEDPWYQLIISLFERNNITLQDKKILEVGCGIGGFTSYLSRIGGIVFGLDISKKAIFAAREITIPLLKKAKTKPQWIIADATVLPLPPKYFDLIICSETLEHTFAIAGTLNQIKRVVVDPGFIVITVPNSIIRYPFDLFNRLTNRGQPELILNYWKILRVIKACNLSIIDEWGADFGLNALVPDIIPDEWVFTPKWLEPLFKILKNPQKKYWRLFSGTIGFILKKNPDTPEQCGTVEN